MTNGTYECHQIENTACLDNLITLLFKIIPQLNTLKHFSSWSVMPQTWWKCQYKSKFSCHKHGGNVSTSQSSHATNIVEMLVQVKVLMPQTWWKYQYKSKFSCHKHRGNVSASQSYHATNIVEMLVQVKVLIFTPNQGAFYSRFSSQIHNVHCYLALCMISISSLSVLLTNLINYRLYKKGDINNLLPVVISM